jgi:ABC-2 type transport system permease protein
MCKYRMIYFATFIAIALGVSARTGSSRTALVVLLAFWFANSLVLTRAAADLAAWLHPSPSAIESGNEVFDRHYGRIFAIYDAQHRVYELAGATAPMLPMRALSMALSGTDVAHHRQFVRAAEDYRRGIQRVMNADIARNARPGVAYAAGPDRAYQSGEGYGLRLRRSP